VSERYAALAADLLASADIRTDGSRPWDIVVNDRRFYKRALAGGSIGLGESYMDGWWDCARLDQLVARVLSADLRGKIKLSPSLLVDVVAEHLPNLPYVVPGLRPFLSRFRSYMAVAETHYEVGNEFYRRMLDRRMVYSCAYWGDAADLDQAQHNKLEMSCRKLRLEPGLSVLDIGCGWGGFAKYAAERYGVSVVGVTISEEQRALAIERCRGLPVEIRLQDYRGVTGRFDRAVSLGMFEHVGRQNFDAYMRVAHGCLDDDGIFLLETIGDNVSGSECNPWFQKYIFRAPTSMFPSIKEIARAVEKRFTVEDWQNFGADYAPTLRAWHDNVAANRDWIVARHGERFYRMWEFYLLSCAGAFASRTYQMWQILFAKSGIAGGFRPVVTAATMGLPGPERAAAE
jgi:cyclopropane-fatty-acyl-phospholipid synthase